MVVVSKRLGSNDTIESVLNRKPRLILEGRGNSSMTEVEKKSARRRNRTISNEIKAKQIQESEIGIVQRISLDVIVDGIDGSGKTTLNANLYSVLARIVYLAIPVLLITLAYLEYWKKKNKAGLSELHSFRRIR